MFRNIMFALYLAIPPAFLPVWKYFSIRETVNIMYPYEWSEDAMVAVATSVYLFGIFIWLVGLGFWAIAKLRALG